MKILRHIRLLPVLVLVSMLSFAVRIGDFYSGLRHSGAAYAQEEVQADAPPLPGAQPAAEHKEETKGDHAAADVPPVSPPDVPMTQTPGPDNKSWRDAGDETFENSEVQAGLYKDLADRRRDLEKKEKELAVRQALMEAAERELDQKLQELTSIRTEIEGLLKTQSAEEDARVGSLVKIYEGMKAKDAANIFNTLEMDVLIRIMTLMSERKSAPILAEMDPERARTVTILLAEQHQMPALDSN